MFPKDSGSEGELGVEEERSSEFGSKDLTFREGDLVVGLVVGRSRFREGGHRFHLQLLVPNLYQCQR